MLVKSALQHLRTLDAEQTGWVLPAVGPPQPLQAAEIPDAWQHTGAGGAGGAGGTEHREGGGEACHPGTAGRAADTLGSLQEARAVSASGQHAQVCLCMLCRVSRSDEMCATRAPDGSVHM
jgi:hypothetical protein